MSKNSCFFVLLHLCWLRWLASQSADFSSLPTGNRVTVRLPQQRDAARERVSLCGQVRYGGGGAALMTMLRQLRPGLCLLRARVPTHLRPSDPNAAPTSILLPHNRRNKCSCRVGLKPAPGQQSRCNFLPRKRLTELPHRSALHVRPPRLTPITAPRANHLLASHSQTCRGTVEGGNTVTSCEDARLFGKLASCLVAATQVRSKW